MVYELKPGVTLDGVHPMLRHGPIPWVIYGVSQAVLGRPPIVTSAASDRLRSDGADNTATWHDNGLALDLRANDRDHATRERYAKALVRSFALMGAIDVIGPYPDPNGHIHIELDPHKLAGFGFAVVAVVGLVLTARAGA